MILVSYFPERARYLFAYQLLILRMYTQFGGTAWLTYDEAFRRDAAARHIIDRSHMNVELYNFHTSAYSGWANPPSQGVSSIPEPPVPRRLRSFVVPGTQVNAFLPLGFAGIATYVTRPNAVRGLSCPVRSQTRPATSSPRPLKYRTF